jgi:VanZ family protein
MTKGDAHLEPKACESPAPGSREPMNWKFVLAALAWMALIFVFSAQPKNEIPAFGGWDLLVKKSGHMLEYAGLVWLWHRALNRRMAWLAWGLAVLYAATDEFHQSFTPGRHATLLDVGIDGLGATGGLLAVIYSQSHIRRVSSTTTLL